VVVQKKEIVSDPDPMDVTFEKWAAVAEPLPVHVKLGSGSQVTRYIPYLKAVILFFV
jgi:hypothetical protein